MSLHCDSLGTGPDVVLVHGWGWHGGIWNDVAEQLARKFRVWIPDLPGHGRSRDAQADFSLTGLMQAIARCVPQSACWVGWSLGGLIALTAAQQRVAPRIVLVGTTPRFVQAADWEPAWTSAWFERFSAELGRDRAAALERFASLHLAGSGNERPLLRQLRAELVRYGAPAQQALDQGLRVLKDTDLRTQLPGISVPSLVVHGECDQIVPPLAGERLAQALPQASFVRVKDAGHALALSHTEHFIDVVGDFAGG